MKAAVLADYDTSLSRAQFVAYQETPDPTITSPSDIIVRIGGAGVCRTDLHIIEGLWRERVSVRLPYIMGHENAGWVEAIGGSIQSVKVGDPVICHPLLSRGETLAARRGNDMHAGGTFPGIDSDGGYAELLKTSERAVVKLPQTLTPKDVAPYADAGLTAYHAVKKAAANLVPGDYVLIDVHAHVMITRPGRSEEWPTHRDRARRQHRAGRDHAGCRPRIRHCPHLYDVSARRHSAAARAFRRGPRLQRLHRQEIPR